MKLKFIVWIFGCVFLVGCVTETNLVIKQASGDFLVIAYGKSRKEAELSASLSANRKCSSDALIKSIETQYVGAIPEKENQIAGKVLDMLNQITDPQGFSLPTSANQDSEAYKSQVMFICE